MGFFDWFRKQPAAATPSDTATFVPETARGNSADALMEIARLVSNGNEAVLQEASKCAFDLQGFYTEQEAFFEEIGLKRSEPASKLQWLGLIKILEDHGYVCERDWKDCLPDFVFFVENLKGVQSNDLPIHSEWFDESEDISVWGVILNKKWSDKGFSLACFDINSDSYVLFTCRTDDFHHLQALAAQLNAGFGLFE